MSQSRPQPVGAVGGRPPAGPDAAAGPAGDPLRDAARSYREFAGGGANGDGHLDSWCASCGGSAAHAGFFREAHLVDPRLASRVAEGVAALPEVGGEFCGFKLVAELGRGAFGRVYLSHQGDLADRPVALKVSAEIREESQRLARLQHTNIVPIYSFHRQGPLQAVCMPYFGSATLADVVADLSRRDALPASGKMVASTVYDRRSRTVRTPESGVTPPSVRPAPPVAPAAERPAPASAPEAPTARELKQLEGLTYVEAVLWIGARLADGLAHAHKRGILHRDLKPANVLLTDDGVPMLLDFNLAEDTSRGPDAAVAQIGGTLPYMAPEHLEAFGGTRREVDARGDVYGLGVILYELLTGRAPFPRHTGPVEKILPRMIEERGKGAPPLCRYNRAVSPAAEAIVRKCLEPDPARRYPGARELQEDLERQLANLPLRHQREPSRRERVRKWLRRNPWVRSAGSVAVVAAAVIVGLVAVAWYFQRRSETEAAINLRTEFAKPRRAAQCLLYARDLDHDFLIADEEEGRAAALRALGLYGVLGDSPWREQTAVRRLPAEERERLGNEVGQLLVLLAGSLVPDEKSTDEQRAEALRLNRLAEGCFGEGRVPRVLWEQRAGLTGDGPEAERLRRQARETPLREGWEHCLAASALKQKGDFVGAIAEAKTATDIDPTNSAGWFYLGRCILDASENHLSKMDAFGYLNRSISLEPAFWAPYFNRGVAYNQMNYVASAEAELTRAAELRPDVAEIYLRRASARDKLGRYQEALQDTERALDKKAPPARVCLMRARLRTRLGDKDGAARELAEGLRLPPVGFQGWMDRGMARLCEADRAEKPDASAYEAALADFAEASRQNRLSRDALRNQAYVLGEKLGRPKEAVRVMDRELELFPDQPDEVAARGVYLARLGHREKALADVRKALSLAPVSDKEERAGVLYRYACVYALLSRLPDARAGDRAEALRYLAAALELGFGFEYVGDDVDLDPLKGEPEFEEVRKLVKKTHELRCKKPSG